jgi:Fur family peroxide stress response transcriptional regulator
MAVIKEFLERTDHPSAESIHRELKADFEMMAVSTVYDTLRLLVELGEAAEVGLGASEARYDPVTVSHGHLICTRCRDIVDIRIPDDAEVCMEPDIPAEMGFEVERTILETYGVCRQCQQSK